MNAAGSSVLRWHVRVAAKLFLVSPDPMRFKASSHRVLHVVRDRASCLACCDNRHAALVTASGRRRAPSRVAIAAFCAHG